MILLLALLAAIVLTPLIVLGRRPDKDPQFPPAQRLGAADFKDVGEDRMGVTIASPIVLGNQRIYVPLPHSASIASATLSIPAAPAQTSLRTLSGIILNSGVGISPVPGPGVSSGYTRFASLPGFTTSNTVAIDGLLVAWLQGVGVTAVDDLTGRAIWTTPLPAPASELTVESTRIYAAGDGEAASALDPQTGRVLWTYRTTDRLTTGVGVSGGVACFGAADRSFHVVDAGTGKPRGTLRLDLTSYGRPVVGGDVAYVAAGFDAQRSLCAIDLKRRTIVWSTPVVEDVPEQTQWENVRGPVLDAQTLYLSVNDQVRAYDARNGKLRWKWQAPPSYVDKSTRYRWPGRLSTPLFYGGAVLVSRHDGVHLLDASSGRLLYHVPAATSDWAPRMASDTPPVVWRDILYFTSDARSIRGVRLPTARKPSTADPRVVPVSGRSLATAAVVALLALGVALLLHLRRAWIAALCLGLSAVTIATWLRSYSESQFFGTRTLDSTPEADGLTSKGIASRNGVLKIGGWRAVRVGALRTRAVIADTRVQFELVPLEQDAENPDDSRPGLGITSFALTRQSRSSGMALGPQSDHSLSVPHWFVAMLLAIPPLAWITGLWRDRRRYPKGHCPQCGYDLRASGEVCPECGTRTVKTVKAAPKAPPPSSPA
jgi:outer membrane protein assembly factor BamB